MRGSRSRSERAYGDRTPASAESLSDRGDTLNLLGRHREARTAFEAALGRWREQLGPDHRKLAHPLMGLGQAQLGLGLARRAVATFERALQLREREEPEALLVAETRFALARALWEAGEQARAATEASRARAAFAALPGLASKAATIDEWMRGHAGVAAKIRT